MSGQKEDLSDSEIDEVVKILDRNGKGNTFGCESVAKGNGISRSVEKNV